MLAEVHAAAVALWKADAAVTALVGQRIYDGLAPTGTPFPYLRIGNPTEAESPGVFGVDGFTDTLTVDAFSQYQGNAELYAVITALHGALAAPLLIDGFLAARLRPEFATTLVEDGGVRHASIRYRITSLETP